jgi:hypothetical protein
VVERKQCQHQVLLVQIQFLVQLHPQVVVEVVEVMLHQVKQVKVEDLVVVQVLEVEVQDLETVHL